MHLHPSTPEPTDPPVPMEPFAPTDPPAGRAGSRRSSSKALRGVVRRRVGLEKPRTALVGSKGDVWERRGSPPYHPTPLLPIFTQAERSADFWNDVPRMHCFKQCRVFVRAQFVYSSRCRCCRQSLSLCSDFPFPCSSDNLARMSFSIKVL
jgi:hypothetical protein